MAAQTGRRAKKTAKGRVAPASQWQRVVLARLASCKGREVLMIRELVQQESELFQRYLLKFSRSVFDAEHLHLISLPFPQLCCYMHRHNKAHRYKHP